MPFFTYQDQLAHAAPLEPLDLDKAGIHEKELQELLARQLHHLDPDSSLMVLAREYGSWMDANRRIDILAIDGDARLVVVELKRTKDGGHAELQALRYAAMLSSLTFSHVVDALWWDRKKADPAITRESAESDLLAFLGKAHADEVQLAPLPRIMLVAQDFSSEITTTVLWLMEHMALDISCYTVTLYPYDGQAKALHIDLLLPLPQQADYLVQVRDKNLKEAQQLKTAITRRQRTCALLEEKKLLQQGDALQLLISPRSGMALPENPSQCQATYLGGGRVRWAFDNEAYSLSSLTSHICTQLGKPVASIQGTAYWGNAKGTLASQADEFF